MKRPPVTRCQNKRATLECGQTGESNHSYEDDKAAKTCDATRSVWTKNEQSKLSKEAKMDITLFNISLATTFSLLFVFSIN